MPLTNIFRSVIIKNVALFPQFMMKQSLIKIAQLPNVFVKAEFQASYTVLFAVI